MKRSLLKDIVFGALKNNINEQTTNDCAKIRARICDPQTGEFTGESPSSTGFHSYPIKIGGATPTVNMSFMSTAADTNGQAIIPHYQVKWVVTAIDLQPGITQCAERDPSTVGTTIVGAGCTDGYAINYDASATTDDGSCFGCMVSGNSNYCPLCTADCNDVPNGADDGCCIPVPVYGCMDPNVTGPITGINNINSCNCNVYDPAVNTDDGSCCVMGCTEGGSSGNQTTNYDPFACIDTTPSMCIWPAETYDCSHGNGQLSNGTSTTPWT